MTKALSLDTAGRSGAPPSPIHAWVVAAALLVPAVVAILWPTVAEWMQYDRALIAGGGWWRALTCHWAHWTTEHFAWDAAVFLLLTALALGSRVRRVGTTIALSAVLVSAAVWIGLPEMTHYRGLSGIDSALFALLCATWLRREWVDGRVRSALALGALLALFPAKIAYELFTGSAAFVATDVFVPVPLAHAVGALVGALVVVGGARSRNGAT